MAQAISIIVEGYNTPGSDRGRKVFVELTSPNADVIKYLGTTGENISGLDIRDTIMPGSICVCETGEIAVLQSDGKWKI